MFQLTTERPEDADEIEALLNEAFGAGRQAKTSYRFRDGVEPVRGLSLVARREDRIVGSIRYWPILVGDAGRPALLLGPLAISPRLQGKGIGAALSFQTLDMAAWAGHRLVLLVGDLAYYRRFGFRPVTPHGIYMPGENPERLHYTELVRGALDGYRGEIRRWGDRIDRPRFARIHVA
ncbi:MAG TPA: N-acetyltransferase [Alphaproteobacteria bacterium]|nr:N-acetyltransferase [Alphaproteobacteria bacterium]